MSCFLNTKKRSQLTVILARTSGRTKPAPRAPTAHNPARWWAAKKTQAAPDAPEPGARCAHRKPSRRLRRKILLYLPYCPYFPSQIPILLYLPVDLGSLIPPK